MLLMPKMVNYFHTKKIQRYVYRKLYFKERTLVSLYFRPKIFFHKSDTGITIKRLLVQLLLPLISNVSQKIGIIKNLLKCDSDTY